MRRRHLLRVTAVCNALVLLAGVAVVRDDLTTRPTVAFDGDAALASSLASPSVEPELPSTGKADLPLASPGARRVDLPHHELDYLPPAMQEGLLDADPQRDGGCAWIVLDDEPQAIRWPAGYQAGFVAGPGDTEVLELIDAAGRVVARGGETVRFAGARSGAPERLERCHFGGDHVWYVDAVDSDPR